MDFFEESRDFYVFGFVPEQVAWEIGVAVLFLVLAFAGFHLLRRAFRRPETLPEGEAPPTNVRRVERYELGARLYHWGNFLVIAGLVLSGIPFYFPGALFPLEPYIGISWLLAHVVLGWTFVVLLVLHIIFSIWRANVRDMWFERRDWRDLGLSVRYYLGLGRSVAKYGKYDVWQKLYHAFLTILALGMIATGIPLFLNAEQFLTLSHEWIRNMRLVHDVGAWGFVAVVAGHVYLRLVVSNWPKLLASVTGNISADHFRESHDWRRWRPKVKEQRPPPAPGE